MCQISHVFAHFFWKQIYLKFPKLSNAGGIKAEAEAN